MRSAAWLRRKLGSPEELERLRAEILARRDPNKTRVRICMTGCQAYGAEAIRDAFKAELKKQKLEDKVEVVETGCHGFCSRAPVIVIDPMGLFYQQITDEDVPEIVTKTIKGGEIIDRHVYPDPNTGERIALVKDVPFYKEQTKLVLRNCGQIDPTNIAHYLAQGGYGALHKVLHTMTPEQVIEEIKVSGLRGRGGAGFPTGLKWEMAKAVKSDIKYVVANGDEGDPGAFMDRGVMEGDPHSVLEGMLICAYAIGAQEGYVYVRTEYPLAVKHLKIAVDQAEELGLLGENILGSGFNFKVTVKEGAGAFVCGEETALIASIEGKRGMPRPRPPYPAQSGLWGKPTNINNVETFVNIPIVILKGGREYAKIGTRGSKGTKIFSVAGKINNTGLVEVPMGITLRKVIFDIGGGLTTGRKFKAVQMGGPSGGCVSAEHLDLPIDYDSLVQVGAIMGSGGLIVMDENTCMVDLARFFLDFISDESCGKCSSCRLGAKRMLEILTRIAQGKGEESDIDLLLEASAVIKDASMCGLGQTASNPVLSTIRHFRGEYEEHVKNYRCPAFVCTDLFTAPCRDTCPVNIEVHGYVALIAEGMFKEALELIKERNPFPAICGRVCHHPCETRCRRADIDEPLALRALKRFVTDHEVEWRGGPPVPIPRTREEKVAIIGSGPAGLACAHALVRKGYGVTVFEALPVAGGALAVGIPPYRLPRDVLQVEIEDILGLGVEIKTGVTIGKNVKLKDLLDLGYKAIFVAVGAHKSVPIGVPGDNLNGVIHGIEFLRHFNLGKKVKLGEKVVVIGGDNAAVDAARTALRLGVKKVSLLYRRGRAEMPADEIEIEEAEREGVKLSHLVMVQRLTGKNGRVSGVECVRAKLGEFDKSGRRRPIPIEGSEFTVNADTVITATGQTPDPSFLSQDDLKLKRTSRGTLVVDNETLQTNVKGVFAGGDVVTGAATVIEAIAAGDRAASSIDRYLRGKKLKEKPTMKPAKPLPLPPRLRKIEEELKEKPRPKIGKLHPKKRIRGFEEVELALTPEQAIEEAKRCLRCHEKE